MADPSVLIELFQEQLMFIQDRSWKRSSKDGEAHLASTRLFLADAEAFYNREQYSEAFEYLRQVLRCTVEAIDCILDKVIPLEICSDCGQPVSEHLRCMCVDENEKEIQP